jgi:5-methylcytosine-specific restriction protein A
LIKKKTICGKCHKIKRDDCDKCKKKPFEGISHENQSFYNSTRWRKYSLALRRENPLCEECLRQGKTTKSEVVDHIKPISKGGDKWDIDNLRCLCHICHNKKTAKSF